MFCSPPLPLPLADVAVTVCLVALLEPSEPLLVGTLCDFIPGLEAVEWNLELFPPIDLVPVVPVVRVALEWGLEFVPLTLVPVIWNLEFPV